jgi:23S rRNA (cytidine1920-2'-O)/16S rRNA (cytidine1409-2'-O)-methyltransferase
MKRLDLVLVEAGLAPSRTKAQELIAAGEVEVFVRGEWSQARSASQTAEAKDIRVREGSEVLRYVSRGGLKLEGALEELGLEVTGFRCVDAGLSTGGFSDCLLQRGAKEICGFDVGHGQLDPRLQNDTRLLSFEGVNVKDLEGHPEIRAWIAKGVDLCVADLSFISTVSVLPALVKAIPASRWLLLIKPQFEAGQENLNKRGVASPESFDDVKGRVLRALEKCGLSNERYFASRVKGQDGNQEFFVFAHRS